MMEWFRQRSSRPRTYGGVLPGKGAITTSTAVSVTGASGTLVLAFNGNRRVAVLVNTHATITIHLGPAAIAVGQGITLAPGASYVDTDSNSAWYAIPASGTVSVSVTEIS